MLLPSGFRPGVAEAREELRLRWRREGLHSGLTIPQAVARSTAPSRLVIQSDVRPADVDGQQIRDNALRVASVLRSLGVRPGDVVACQMPSWAEMVYVSHAAYAIGAILAPIVGIYGPREVGFILAESKARVFITPDRFGGIDYLANMDAWPDLPHLEHRIVVGDRAPAGAQNWDEIVAGADPLRDLPDLSPDDICLLIYTSGTTSNPKGVLHTHASLLAPKHRAGLGPPPGARLASLPMGHIGAVMAGVSMLVDGETIVTMDKWSADHAVELVERFGCVRTSGTPFFLTTFLEAAHAQGRDMTSLTHFNLGATAITPADVMVCERAGIAGFRSYGSTEHPISMTGDPVDPLSIRAYSDGLLCMGNAVRIVDEEGRDVPDGEAGEIAVIGPQQFAGYTNPEFNAAQFLPGGWFLTGDVARRDTDTGAYVLTDRKKDIIIRGGENISAKEVEDALSAMPGVMEAAAVAMPDTRLGEKVCAFVIAQPGVDVSLPAVRQHFLTAGLAKQKTPERIEVVAELPRTPTGKIKKFELRDRLRLEAQASESRGEPVA